MTKHKQSPTFVQLSPADQQIFGELGTVVHRIKIGKPKLVAMGVYGDGSWVRVTAIAKSPYIQWEIGIKSEKAQKLYSISTFVGELAEFWRIIDDYRTGTLVHSGPEFLVFITLVESTE